MVVAGMILPAQAMAQSSDQYTMQEIVDAGHGFFGSTTGGLAKVVEQAFQRYGLPNGYILGQEGSGAFVAGLVPTKFVVEYLERFSGENYGVGRRPSGRCGFNGRHERRRGTGRAGGTRGRNDADR